MPGGPLGGPRPFVETQDIWFNASLNINKQPSEQFSPDSTTYRSILHDYISTLVEQQPEIDPIGGTVYIRQNEWAILESGGTMGYASARSNNRNITHMVDSIDIDMRFEEPVLVASHVLDTNRIVEDNYRRFSSDDFRILPKGLLRDQRDYELENDAFDFEIPTDTLV